MKNTFRNRLNNGHGFTLIEVMVAAMILLFAMAGIVPFFLGGLSQASSLRYKSVATNVARERMEEIRQLDYREITEDPAEGPTLTERFGSSSTQRGIDFNVAYIVEESAYEQGTLKKVTVNVGWDAPPKVSPAAITTLIHQQFLGPRGAYLEITPTSDDSLGTPFRMIDGDRIHDPSRMTKVIYHLAEADWGLAYDNLDQPVPTPRNIYMRLLFVDDNGQSISIGDAGNDFKIDNSYLSAKDRDGDGTIDDVYFEYDDFDAMVIPDGYWEVQALAYNEYDEPGNLWRLRTRVEMGPPDAPTNFLAVPQADNQTVALSWAGGPERDRSHYVLERRTWDGTMWPESWVTLGPNLDPNANTYTDQGSVSDMLDPWGDAVTQNQYQYRIWAVDFDNPQNVGPATQAEALIPDPTSTTTTTLLPPSSTTTTSSSTTTTLASYSAVIENTVNKVYDIVIRDSSNNVVYSGSVGKNGTLTVSDLPAGNFLVTATAPGKEPRQASFSLPAHNGQVVLTIT